MVIVRFFCAAWIAEPLNAVVFLVMRACAWGCGALGCGRWSKAVKAVKDGCGGEWRRQVCRRSAASRSRL